MRLESWCHFIQRRGRFQSELGWSEIEEVGMAFVLIEDMRRGTKELVGGCLAWSRIDGLGKKAFCFVSVPIGKFVSIFHSWISYRSSSLRLPALILYRSMFFGFVEVGVSMIDTWKGRLIGAKLITFDWYEIDVEWSMRNGCLFYRYEIIILDRFDVISFDRYEPNIPGPMRS